MAKLPHANSRRMYSWWWDSHISPKNSKWLQDNLTDMDAKVKSMIKLIEEDADSFARRAEMYYKKRPELMKMVKEFYRAYRALAERYDHATGALVQAHRTMTEAFPNQVSPGLIEDELASFSSENKLHTPEDQYTGDRKGVKQFKYSVGSGDDGKLEGGKVRRGLNFDEDGEKKDQSTHHVVKLEKEIRSLKEALSKFEAEKESSLAHYKHTLEKLSHQELEFSRVQEDSKKNLKEVENLNIALKMLEGEKETTLVQYQKYLEKIKDMEGIISHAQKHVFDLNERAQKAEAEVQTLKLDLATMESEKSTTTNQWKQSLVKISGLESKLSLAEDIAERLNKRAEEAEIEVESLKKALTELGVEKEANAVQYQQCLDTISTLEKKISSVEEEVQMLNGELERGVSKIKGAEEKCILMEKSNQSLHSELESLSLKLGVQSEELKEKKCEIGILLTSVEEERLRFVEAETAFQTLHLMHARTEEELKYLTLELQNKAITISDLETHNQIFLNESLKTKEGNERLNELNLASSMSIEDKKNEILSLLETKVKLEEEVVLQVNQKKAFQQETYCLKLDLATMESEKITSADQWKQSLEKISGLESKLSLAEDIEERLNKRAEEAEIEVETLKKGLTELGVEKEANAVQYQQFLDTILTLEKKISSVEEEVQMLNGEPERGVSKIKGAEEKCILMEKSNQSLHSELESLSLKLGVQSEELKEKKCEIGILLTSEEEERLRFVEAETAFQTLHLMHARTEEELKYLTLELQNKAITISDLETHNQIFLNESLKIEEENERLNELNLASSMSIEDKKNEILSLLETKVKLEEEVVLQVDQKKAFQQETYCLKLDLATMESEKITSADQWKQSLEKISGLESKLSLAEDIEERLNKRAEEAEIEVETLKKGLTELGVEKEANAVQYQQCLDTISTLKKKISSAKDEVQILNGEIERGVSKIKGAEEKCILMEKSNQSLHSELESLSLKLGVQSEELMEKKREIGMLLTSVQEEQLMLVEAEAAFQTLHLIHSRTEEELKSLTLELQNKAINISDLEAHNQILLNESLKIKEENERLNELNLASSVSIEDKKNEIISLLETKLKLEKEVVLQVDQKRAFQQEIYCLKLDLATMESEKSTSTDQWKQSLEKISCLDSKLSLAENIAERLNKRAEEAEIEARTLKKTLTELGVEKEANAVQYQQCLDTILTLEKKITSAEEEVEMLNVEIETGVSKIKGAEEKCISMEKSNRSLHSELESLSLKLGVQSKELKEKKREIGILWTSLQEERLRFVEAETAFQTLHLMHTRTEEELKSLTLEIQNKAISISDLETHNQILLNESLKIKEENETLNELNLASSVSVEDKQNEIISLLETTVKLEEEVVLQVDRGKAFQQEIYNLNQELNDFDKKYLALLNQVEAVGYNPECFQSVVKSLQDENQNLKESLDRQIRERVDLLRKLENLQKVEEENTLLEKSLSDLSSKLDASREERLALENSFKSVSDEKSTLDMEKAAIKTQLQVAREDLVKLLEKNAFMENSVSDAHDEIEGMKIQLKSLEDMCQILEKEKSDFISENGNLVFQVEINRQRLEDLENKYQGLEDECSVLKKEKESAVLIVEEMGMAMKKRKQEEEKQTIEIENLHGKVLNVQKRSVTLQVENSKLLDEKMSMVREFLDLQQQNNTLEGENCLILSETASLSNLTLIFKSIINEKSVEIEELRSNVDKLQGDSVGFEDKINVMERKLEEAQLENMDLKKLLKNTEDNLSAITFVNDQLNVEIEDGKNLFYQKETEISEAMSKVADTENKKSELQIVVAHLKEKNEKIKMLWDEANRKQIDEISFLEREATKLISELHTSYVFRALIQEKFQESTGLLKQLQEEKDSKNRDIELLNERIGVLEGENGEIGAQLAEYAPAINTLKDSICSLEDRTCFKQLQNTNHEEIKVTAGCFENHEETNADQKELDNLSALKDLDTRVKAVEKIVIETNNEVEARTRLVEELGSNGAINQENVKPLPVNTEPENGLLAKDMMLNEVSECSPYLIETEECTTADVIKVNEKEKITTGIDFDSGVKVEKKSSIDELANGKRFSLPNQELDKSKILERLNSDCQKVTSLQITVQDLKRKMEMREKRIEDKFSGECESIEGQLVKAEEDISQLSDFNSKLMKQVDTSDNVKAVVESEESRNLRRKISEQARKVSERIGKMQLEVQRIQFLMLKLEITNGEDNKRKSEVTERKRRTVLHDYLGLRTSNRRKKWVFCGCVHPPSTAD